jgi:iron(III) transport system substrate-binding protein
MRLLPLLAAVSATLATALTAPVAGAADKVLNLYTARHYQTDERLYADFEQQTGIKVVRLEGKDDELVERLRQEGARSPADVLVTVDVARLARASELGLFRPVASKTLETRIPAHLRGKDWFAFSTRARVIVRNKATVPAADVASYQDLAAPKLKGKVCSRPGSHPYNLSLGAALITHLGEPATEAWARGLVANFARPPQGGDTDQIKAVAAGECGVAVSNTYYLARLLRSEKPEDKAVMDKVAIVWPNQDSFGVHMNVSGAGVMKHARNPDNAVKFLEYLASDSAQRYFADGNNEWPVVPGVQVDNPALKAMGEFRADTVDLQTLAENTAKAQMLFDRAGYR